MADPATTRRTYGPVVLLGLSSAGLAAFAGTRPWVSVSGAEPDPGVAPMTLGEVSSSPLATALAFVILACWGVLLVTRGRFRHAIAWLALVVAVGHVATVAVAPFTLPDHLVDQVRKRTGSTPDDTSLTVWFAFAVVAALLVVGSVLLAVRWVRSWPEMGSRYDAPASTPQHDDAPPETNIDIWKAIDEGRDPTA